MQLAIVTEEGKQSIFMSQVNAHQKIITYVVSEIYSVTWKEAL